MASGRPKVVVVASEGDTAPGTGGLTFSSATCGSSENRGSIPGFDEPQTNDAGGAAFDACLSDGSGGVFLKQKDKSIVPVALGGQTVPGIGGTFSTVGSEFEGPRLNQDNTVAFANNAISGGTATGALFLKKKDGPLTAIVRQGDSAPGTNNGVFGAFDDLSMNHNNDVAFIASYTEDGGITFKAGVFLYSGKNGSVTNVALDGDSLPGTGGGVVFAEGTLAFDPLEAIDGPWLNDKDVVAFTTDVSGGSISDTDGSVFARQPGQPIQPFVLVGDPVPSPTGGTIGSSIAIGTVGLNNQNVLGFDAEVDGSNATDAVVASKKLGGSIEVCARDGDHAPGTTGTFSSATQNPHETPPTGLSKVSINDDGSLIFHSDVVGDTTNFQGIFDCKRGSTDALVLTGDTRPNGGTYGNTEEEAVGGNAVVFDDEINTPIGVYLIPHF
jgi:hypothetical protein